MKTEPFKETKTMTKNRCSKCGGDSHLKIEGGILYHTPSYGGEDIWEKVVLDEDGPGELELEMIQSTKETTLFCGPCLEKTQWNRHRCPKCNDPMDHVSRYDSSCYSEFDGNGNQVGGSPSHHFETVVLFMCKSCDVKIDVVKKEKH